MNEAGKLLALVLYPFIDLPAGRLITPGLVITLPAADLPIYDQWVQVEGQCCPGCETGKCMHQAIREKRRLLLTEGTLQ
jgi:hypothetical protein